MKQYRFFYHYRKQTGRMTVHYRGTCYNVNDVSCLVPCRTKRNKRQPYLVMEGFCGDVFIDTNTDTAIIQ